MRACVRAYLCVCHVIPYDLATKATAIKRSFARVERATFYVSARRETNERGNLSEVFAQRLSISQLSESDPFFSSPGQAAISSISLYRALQLVSSLGGSPRLCFSPDPVVTEKQFCSVVTRRRGRGRVRSSDHDQHGQQSVKSRKKTPKEEINEGLVSSLFFPP